MKNKKTEIEMMEKLKDNVIIMLDERIKHFERIRKKSLCTYFSIYIEHEINGLRLAKSIIKQEAKRIEYEKMIEELAG